MTVTREIRRRARQITPQILFACLVGYFCYHVMQGDRGVLAWLQLKQELAQVRALNLELTARRAGLEKEIALMRPDHLDPDILEERARAILNYGQADDYIVIFPGGQ